MRISVAASAVPPRGLRRARRERHRDERYLATHDALTDLPNRRLFTDRLDAALRRPSPVSVLLFDLDRFKLVNDSFGHATGDELLVAVAQRLGAALRPPALLARLGGDEFAVLLEQDAQQALGTAHRLLAAFAEPFALTRAEVRTGASIGVASRPPALLGPDLLADADQAAYLAKRRGRGSVEVAPGGASAEARKEVLTEVSLRRALDTSLAHQLGPGSAPGEDGYLELRYQPVVNVAPEVLHKCEALVRWRRPEGLVEPDSFISLAEETGAVVDLGAWVLREALRQARAWSDAEPGLTPVSVSVNVSVRQLTHPGLVDLVRSSLEESGVDPALLVLEVTESTLVDRLDLVRSVLDDLKGLGVVLALDDFGTGHSSLAYLRDLPFDVVKVDRAFTARLDDPSTLAVVTAVVGLARALGLEVVVEGVETPEQLRTLTAMGVEWFQGALVAMPLAAEDLAKVRSSA